MSAEISDRGRQASAVSNGITRLHREHYGRGATSSRTIIERNYVVCFLEDIYTPVERTLIDAGKEEAVLYTRQIFQQAMRANLVEIVQDATGRNVTAFMSQNHFAPDLACEIFVLEPQETDAATNSDRAADER